MRGRRVTALQRHAAVVEATGPGWASGPLLVACTHGERRRGLRPRPAGCGLLLAARSVHGFGMREALLVVTLDATGRVRRVATLRPGRVLWDRGARWALELPLRGVPPQEGDTLRLRRFRLPSVDLSSAHGGDAAPVRRAHRQPG